MIPDRILELEEVDSTLDWVRVHFQKMTPNSSVVFSRVQTKGRGQYGRNWYSVPGGLYFSMRICPVVEEDWELKLIQSLSLNVVSWLQTKGIDARLKFPNDVYVGSRKLMGVLVENVFSGNSLSLSILGCGLNVFQDFEEGGQDFSAVSLKQLGLYFSDLQEVLHEVLRGWEPIKEGILWNP